MGGQQGEQVEAAQVDGVDAAGDAPGGVGRLEQEVAPVSRERECVGAAAVGTVVGCIPRSST